MVALGQNHVEHWMTTERGVSQDINGVTITVGHEWFQSWPSSRRLRWPIGRRQASVLGWVVTRAQMLAGPFLESENPMAWLGEFPSFKDWIGNPDVNGEPDDNAEVQVQWVHGIGLTNPRQGWSPTGEVIRLTSN